MEPRDFIRRIRTGLFFLLFVPALLHAQSKTVHTGNQYWIGYMTSSKIAEKYSVWNDFHLVPEGFCVVRTGLTRHFANTAITGGYAFLWLPPGSGKTALTRLEHRPWGQIQFNLPVNDKFSLTQRIRYDARFRERVVDGEVVDGYSFNHRVRFLISAKRILTTDAERTVKPYVSVSNEILLNFGKEISFNTFDQNRLSVAVGLQTPATQYQLGFMNRFVQNAPDRYTLNHTIVLWITQKFDFTKLSRGINKTDNR